MTPSSVMSNAMSPASRAVRAMFPSRSIGRVMSPTSVVSRVAAPSSVNGRVMSPATNVSRTIVLSSAIGIVRTAASACSVVAETGGGGNWLETQNGHLGFRFSRRAPAPPPGLLAGIGYTPCGIRSGRNGLESTEPAHRFVSLGT
jgi:hypothetical protein